MKFTLLFALILNAAVCAADKPFTMPGLKQDIEFAKAGDVSLTLDASVPEGEGPFITCILVHGGGFTKGDKHSFIKPLFEPLSKAGFVWFTINYRLAPEHAWPACADDVASAIKWVKAHAAEYKVDVNRIALIGESAGGHLVSWAGVMGEGETRVAAVVPFYPPQDLVVQVERRRALGGLGGLIGTEELNEAALKKLAEISPINHVRSGLPPFLQIHGDKDETVPISQSVNFEAKTKAAGNRCETITVPGGIHGMGGWEKLGSDYQAQMIAWLRKTLK
ncbi:MAG: alpha/beta hydrolase [Prosthecobacter sp.]|uniref:alpha/beta hydrolase n=1 Tax=Prosthecobacter sp. TaxID=1965333 RepID=UPI002619DF93|nr:alpha/beta hydrolase [Prosthecobacter sp.]MCF7789060.1 alpha/beta hydrolase [Prosthecobacter sp.]